MSNRSRLLTILFCLLLTSAFAQEDQNYKTNSDLPYEYKTQEEINKEKQQAQQRNESSPRRSYKQPGHWSFGGWFSMAFWNGGTDLLLAPKAYYHVSPKFLTGFGITYIYSDYKDDFISYHSNSIGGSLMVAARPVPSFQLSAEYEGLNTTRIGYFEDTYWSNALYLGASFVSGPVSFGVRYDVLYDPLTSAYGSAWTPFIGFYF